MNQTYTESSLPDTIRLFSGTSSPKLAQSIATELGHTLGKCEVARFSDGEVHVEILENVRGRDVFIIQSLPPPAENLMELLLMADAMRRSSATRVTAVIPYFGYSRQDRRVLSRRVPISAAVVAEMLMQVGISRVLTVELHSEQIQGFFNMPVDNLYTTRLIKEHVVGMGYPMDDITVVSPDIGGVVRARALAKELNDRELAIVDKRRSQANHSQVMNIIGDVRGKICIMPDDIVDTAGTLVNAAVALKDAGAQKVLAYVTHGLLSGVAADKLGSDTTLDQLVVTNSLTLPSPIVDKLGHTDKVMQIESAPLLAEAIKRIKKSDSVSSLYSDH